FPRAIEDCKLWNKENPEGPFRDWRTWGAHLDAVVDGDPATELAADWWQTDEGFLKTGLLMDQGLHAEAIPILCSLILRSERQYLPVAWIRLSLCLELCGEAKLAFLMMRDTLKLRDGIPRHFAAEFSSLEAFSDDPTSHFGKDFDLRSKALRLGADVRYAEWNFHTTAFDIRVDGALSDQETKASHWFEMGKSHAMLEERSLAELFMRRAALKATTPSLRDRFTAQAESVHGRRQYQRDPGLDVDRRRAERRLTSPDRVLGPDGPLTRRSNDDQAESAYWLVVCEETSAEEIANRVVARLRFERRGFLLDIPSDCHGSLFYLLSCHARDTLTKISAPIDVPTLKQMNILEIVEGGLVQQNLHHHAAALFAIFHDEIYQSVRFSPEDLEAKALPLAQARQLTARQLAAAGLMSTGYAGGLRTVAEGALDSLEALEQKGALDPQGQQYLKTLKDWTQGLRGS
ncbi:MAG: hypothetical protein AAF368_10490, partial [Planctomycetota bacterium]